MIANQLYAQEPLPVPRKKAAIASRLRRPSQALNKASRARQNSIPPCDQSGIFRLDSAHASQATSSIPTSLDRA